MRKNKESFLKKIQKDSREHNSSNSYYDSSKNSFKDLQRQPHGKNNKSLK